VRKTGRALLVSSSALLCTAWSFAPKAEEAKATAEPTLGGVASFEEARVPIEIGPAAEDAATIELDPSPAQPEVLPSAGEDLPQVLEDVAL
jgi:hypothetical protein